MLMLDEAPAGVTTELDLDDIRGSPSAGRGKRDVGRLDVEKDQRAIEAFLWTLLPDFPAAPALVRSLGGHFMDKPDNVISMINLATVRALEALWRVPIDPLRFRANIYIDGAKPREEFDWIGRDVRIGGATFTYDRKNGRCGATNVNPATGERDLDIPSSLRLAVGHKNLGVYLTVREGGLIAPGDRLALSGELGAAAEADAPALTAARGRFICRGCDHTYDEAQGNRSRPAPFSRALVRRALPGLRDGQAILRPLRIAAVDRRGGPREGEDPVARERLSRLRAEPPRGSARSAPSLDTDRC